MTTQPENKDKAEQKKIAKDELSEKELEKTTGGLSVSKLVDKASPKG